MNIKKLQSMPDDKIAQACTIHSRASIKAANQGEHRKAYLHGVLFDKCSAAFNQNQRKATTQPATK